MLLAPKRRSLTELLGCFKAQNEAVFPSQLRKLLGVQEMSISKTIKQKAAETIRMCGIHSCTMSLVLASSTGFFYFPRSCGNLFA